MTDRNGQKTVTHGFSECSERDRRWCSSDKTTGSAALIPPRLVRPVSVKPPAFIDLRSVARSEDPPTVEQPVRRPVCGGARHVSQP
ncbi:hypothetical protein AOLI_G00151570 [Acnodon oligacanthus]